MSEARPNAPEGPLARPEPWFATALRVLVHGITAGVIAFPLTVIEGVLAAVVGAATGSFAARFVARSGVRLPAILLLGLGALGAVAIARVLVVDFAFLPALLGPAQALRFGDVVVFGGGGFVISTVLRTLSARRSSFTIVEAALIAGGFATLVVAHRNGAIHRPYEIADPLIARGDDPAIALLIIGAGGAIVIGLLLLSEQSLLRSAFHLGVVAALLLAILGTTTMMGLPTPPSTGGALGLQDDDSEERQQARGQGGGSGQGRRESDELQFLDEYPSGGGSPDAVIIFHDDYSPPGGYYYFRQSAFSQFNGQKLIAAGRQDVDRDVHNLFPSGRSRDVEWAPQAGVDRTTVETTVALLADNSAPLGLEAPERFVPATNPHPERFRRLYRVHSVSLTADIQSLLGRRAGDPDWSDEVREMYLQHPDDPRYRELAERIVSGLPEHLREDPWAKALAITQFLGEHGTYSLRSRHAGAEDPTAHFLFGDLTGYCVHFAHAAVYLMRAVGLPARVGTGYAVAEANRQGGSALLLRNSDQHAWPEIYIAAAEIPERPELEALRSYVEARAAGTLDALSLEQRTLALDAALATAIVRLGLEIPLPQTDEEMERWEPPRLDASTPERAEEELARIAGELPQPDGERAVTVDDLLRIALEEMEGEAGPREAYTDAGWVVADVSPQNVLDPPGEPPDPQLQQLLAEMARGSTPLDDVQPPRSMTLAARELWDDILAFFTLTVVLVMIGGGIGGPLFLLFALKTWRRLAPRLSARPRYIYRAALDALGENGVRRRFGESPEAFARRVRETVPSLTPLTDRYLAAAFGLYHSEEHARSMLGDASVARRELAKAVPLWRRLLGVANPFSWLLTR